MTNQASSLIEYTFTTEAEARTTRRYFIDGGRTVSLLSFDTMRNLYVFDLYL